MFFFDLFRVKIKIGRPARGRTLYIGTLTLVITINAYNLNEIVMENTGYITIVYYIRCIMHVYIGSSVKVL